MACVPLMARDTIFWGTPPNKTVPNNKVLRTNASDRPQCPFVSWGKLATRTTQPTSRIRSLTSTFAGLKEDTCTNDSLLINAERGLVFVMAWRERERV
ncbi:hypothetical protein TNCV_2655081 [Trichonephila clavipes]|nr:hypothetical protein TNCV_2655081 [Trichonephila clavipes]